MNKRSHLARRHARERWFRRTGLLALFMAGGMLFFLVSHLLISGVKGMVQVRVTLDIPTLVMAERSAPESFVKQAMLAQFPEAQSRREKRALFGLLAPNAVRYLNPAHDSNAWVVPLSSAAELWVKDGSPANDFRRYGLQPQQAAWLTQMQNNGQLSRHFNSDFFLQGDSRDPERAGFGGSIVGSFFLLIVCIGVSLPIGVGAAIYLEEFAPKSRIRDLIEVNINNLAAIPSIIFGLLGLFVYIVLFGMPRSSALVGGLTLSLMTLPVIIISTRVALAAVPDSLRDAARALGASPLQIVMHHVLPLATSGIITGTILGIARALGETAPLIMIGMVAFIASPPTSVFDPATAMPVQIYLWASSPEQGFIQKTASGIVILVTLLLCLNMLATYIRRKSEYAR
jgi:phosphate transport system permease protein